MHRQSRLLVVPDCLGVLDLLPQMVLDASIFKRDYNGLCRGSLGSARNLRAASGILPGTSVTVWPREVRLIIHALGALKVVW